MDTNENYRFARKKPVCPKTAALHNAILIEANSAICLLSKKPKPHVTGRYLMIKTEDLFQGRRGWLTSISNK